MSKEIKEQQTAIDATTNASVPTEEQTIAIVNAKKEIEKAEKESAKEAAKLEKIDKKLRVVNGEDLRLLMEKYPNVSIRQLSLALNVTYGLVLKASKAPIPGQAYDPEATNWDALANEFIKRNKSLLEDNEYFNWQELNDSKNVNRATLTKNMDEFEVGTKVYLRKNNETPYTIVYKTGTHIVIQLDGTSEPQAWSHQTFLYNGPSFAKRDTEETTNNESEPTTEDK